MIQSTKSGLVCMFGKEITISKVQELYLDYVNNFLTVERFAEYYEIEESQAVLIIEQGRKLQEIYSDLYKALK